VIADEKTFRETLKDGLRSRLRAKILLFGVRPTRPETGMATLRLGLPSLASASGAPITEKPDAVRAAEFLKLATTCGTVECFCGAPERSPGRWKSIFEDRCFAGEDCGGLGTREFESTFKTLYPKCENISVDYAILEPRSAKGGSRVEYLVRAGGFWLE